MEEKELKMRPKMNLVGRDGNIFSLLGTARRLLRDDGMVNESNEMTDRVMNSKSYYEALGIISEYVDTELSTRKTNVPQKDEKKNKQPER